MEGYIAGILNGSHLPLLRRHEVAEELRGHLEQLVQSKREDGLVEQEALEAALQDFGPPEVVQRQLRRQHAIHERRAALAGARRFLPALALVSMLLAGCIALASSTALLPWRIVATAAAFASVLLATGPIVYIVCLAALRTKQPLPRQEFQYFPNAAYWFILVAFCICVSEVILGAGAIAILASFQRGMPHLVHDVDVGQVSLACGRGVMIEAGPTMASFSLLTGLIIAFYQRRRCPVDTAESTT
jgi:hypothetical protein